MTRYRIVGILIASAGLLSAQVLSQEEQLSLQRALSEGGNSPTELELALENHLKQYPNSPRRAEKEVTGAAGRIDHRKLEYRLGSAFCFGPGKHGLERAVEQGLNQAVGRIVAATRLARVSAGLCATGEAEGVHVTPARHGRGTGPAARQRRIDYAGRHRDFRTGLISHRASHEGRI